MRACTVLAAAAIALASNAHAADDFEAPLRALAENELRRWLAEPGLLAALKAQNVAHQSLTAAEIERMDAEWQSELGGSAKPNIDRVLALPQSAWLRERKESSAGLITEVFVMDARGLNVAQSDVTSDLWQGDEAKWQETYGAGPAAIHISEVEFDDSTQTYQSQVSLTVVDPATGEALGAATFGIDVSLIQ